MAKSKFKSLKFAKEDLDRAKANEAIGLKPNIPILQQKDAADRSSEVVGAEREVKAARIRESRLKPSGQEFFKRKEIQAKSPEGLAMAEIQKERAIADFNEALLNTPPPQTTQPKPEGFISPQQPSEPILDNISQLPSVEQDVTRVRAEQEAAANQPGIPGRVETLAQTTPKVLDAIDNVTNLLRPLLPEFIGGSGGFLKFSTQKPAAVRRAEQAFQDITPIMDSNLIAVSEGKKSVMDAAADADRAIESIINLESALHGAGKLDVAYWVDRGASIETQILKQKRALEDYKAALIIAGQEGRLAKAKQNLVLNNQQV